MNAILSTSDQDGKHVGTRRVTKRLKVLLSGTITLTFLTILTMAGFACDSASSDRLAADPESRKQFRRFTLIPPTGLRDLRMSDTSNLVTDNVSWLGGMRTAEGGLQTVLFTAISGLKSIRAVGTPNSAEELARYWAESQLRVIKRADGSLRLQQINFEVRGETRLSQSCARYRSTAEDSPMPGQVLILDAIGVACRSEVSQELSIFEYSWRYIKGESPTSADEIGEAFLESVELRP